MARKRSKSGRPDPVRRRILKGLGAAIGSAAIGCADDGAATTSTTTSGTGGSGTGGAGGHGQSSHASSGSGQGGQGGGMPDGCVDTGGLPATDLLSKIENVVVLCMENRSFDHYLGSRRFKEHRVIDGLTGAESNPDPNGVPVPVFKLDNFTVSNPPHDWDPVHQQWDGGLNDGFVQAHAGPHQQEVMGYHVREQLPVTYALADAFTVCDRYFASVLGPTWPNRFYLHGATAQGTKGNTPNFGYTSIFDLLDAMGISNANYFGDVPWCSGAYFKTSNLHTIDTFLADAAAGNLPSFSIIDPSFFGSGATDDHPNHDVRLGQAFISTIFTAVAQSPQWSKTLFVLTYDEHGGFHDHVPPPTTVDADPEFAQLGFRVPTIVCGPFARKGCVVSTELEHVSIIKTLVTRFGVPSLNGRVDATNDLSSTINPAFLDAPQAPPVLPPAPVSLRSLRERLDGRNSQPELWDMVERGVIPRHLDRRADSFEATKRWLLAGARLGAVRIVD